MTQEKTEREEPLTLSAQEVRARMRTARSEFVSQDQAFSAARSVIEAARNE